MLQFNHLCILKFFLKIQNILDVSSPEFIDGLVIIPHHTEVLIFTCQKAYKLKLYSICILILIHHYVTKPLLIVFQHIRLRLKQLHCFHKQIIKIKCIICPELFFIFPVDFCNLLLSKISCRVKLIFFGRNHFVFCRGNSCQKTALFVHLCVNSSHLAHVSHQYFLIVPIINSKIIFIAQSVDISSQYPYTGRMESTHPDALRAKAYQLIHSLSHLSCRLIGKCNCQDIPRIHALFLYQIGDSVSQHPCLS